MVHEFVNRPEVKTPLGHGYAILVRMTDENNYWTVVLDNGAPVDFTQNQIRFVRCYTSKRGITDNQMKAILNGKADHPRTTRRKRK